MLKYLSTLNYESLKDTISILAPNTRRDYLGYDVADEYTVRAQFIDFLGAVLHGRIAVTTTDTLNIFKMAAFIAPFDRSVKNIVSSYLDHNNRESFLQELSTVEQSPEIISFWRKSL